MSPVLERAGSTVSYLRAGGGAGTPLLLLHGYGCSAGMWEPNLAALGRDRPVVAVDLPGHGGSGSPADPARYRIDEVTADLAAVLDEIGVERAVLAGHSLGGYCSLSFALAHPGRVAALVLVDTGPGFRDPEARARWNARAVRVADALGKDGVEVLGDSPGRPAGTGDATGLAHAARELMTQADDQVMRRLGSVTVPVLVVVGEHDAPFRAAADYFAAKLPDARAVVIPGAGHLPSVEEPAAFDEAVTAFLAGR